MLKGVKKVFICVYCILNMGNTSSEQKNDKQPQLDNEANQYNKDQKDIDMLYAIRLKTISLNLIVRQINLIDTESY